MTLLDIVFGGDALLEHREVGGKSASPGVAPRGLAAATVAAAALADGAPLGSPLGGRRGVHDALRGVHAAVVRRHVHVNHLPSQRVRGTGVQS